MKEILYLEALHEALTEEMDRDNSVFILGEDVGPYGGAFKVTQNLLEKYGASRIIDTPISEASIVGSAIGAALTGMRPIAEIMFGDLTALAMDQICNQAAKIHYMFGGQGKCPMVLRTPFGAGLNIAEHHSQSLEAWFTHTPGLKVVAPSTPFDAKGLLKSAIRDDNPVIFCEHKQLYRIKGSIPEEEYMVPIGKADVKREGSDITLIATMWMVQKSLKAAEKLAEDGIDVEVVDLRTLNPIDKKTIIESIMKTHKAITISEDTKTAGMTAEVSAIIMEEAFDYLDAPVMRLAEPDTPIPFSPPLENHVIPNEELIIKTVKEIIGN